MILSAAGIQDNSSSLSPVYSAWTANWVSETRIYMHRGQNITSHSAVAWGQIFKSWFEMDIDQLGCARHIKGR